MSVSIVIHGEEFEISRENILRVASSAQPASVRRYYVEIKRK